VHFSDSLFGLVLLGAAVAIVWHAQSFPAMPGQDYGPALFPVLIGVGFGLCGAALLVGGLRRRQPWVQWDDWVHSHRHLANFLAVPVALGFYILASDWLGFLPTSVLLLTGLFVKLRGRPLSSLVVAVAVTLLIHTVFSRYLLVPLPWGLLTPLAW